MVVCASTTGHYLLCLDNAPRPLDSNHRGRAEGFPKARPSRVDMVAEMARRRDEADYVLDNLRRAREQVLIHPEWFTPVALERIEQAISQVQEVRQAAQCYVELKTSLVR